MLVAYCWLCHHCRHLAEGGCLLSWFHFTPWSYFLGHVAYRNLPWEGLISSYFEGGLHFPHLGGGGGCRKWIPRSNSLITEDLVSHTFFRSISHFRLFLSDFEGVLPFLHLGGRGLTKTKTQVNSLIIEDQVVSYTSQVEKAVSSYLRVILRVVFIFGS